MTLQIRAIPRQKLQLLQLKKRYHDITNPGNPQTDKFGQEEVIKMYHDITNPGNPQTIYTEAINTFSNVPWHYKSGQSPDRGGCWLGKIEIVPWHYKSGQSPDPLVRDLYIAMIGYHDITNPGNPQTERNGWKRNGRAYHDITNPGNPQTFFASSTNRKIDVPWHYKSGQSPDEKLKCHWKFKKVPWHYKSGQSPDRNFTFQRWKEITYHDITNPGNPQTIWICDLQNQETVPWHYKSGQSPDTKQLGMLKWISKVPWHYKSGQSPDAAIAQAVSETEVPWHYKSGQSPDLYFHCL